MEGLLHVVFAALVVHLSTAEHTRLIADPGNGEIIPVDLTVRGHVVETVSGEPFPPQRFFKSSINMYDFDEKKEARKVLGDACYIKNMTADFEQFEKFYIDLKSSENHVAHNAYEEWNIPGAEIKSEDLEATVGAEIAEFCSGYRVYWLISSKKLQKAVARRVRRQSKNKNWKIYMDVSYNAMKGTTWKVGVSFSF